MTTCVLLLVVLLLLCRRLSSAGVLIQGSGTGTWSVLVTLAGKPLGIMTAVAIALAAGLHLPHRVSRRDVIVLAFTASIGFTFSLFLATTTFAIGPVLIEANTGALSTITGALLALGTSWALRVGRFAR